MSDDQQAPQPPAPSSGYGQPYGYGPQPYDYPQHYATAPTPQSPYAYGYGYGQIPPNSPYGSAYGAPPAPPAPPAPVHQRNWMLIGGCAAVVAAAVIAIGVATNHTTTTAGTALDGSAATVPGTTQPNSNQNPFGSSGNGSTGNGSTGNGSTGNGSTSTGTGSTTTTTAAQEIGIVDIDTIVDYNEGEAAGTGMVLTSNGEILTNNHVIDGATTIRVTVISTGKTYAATVVGDSPTNDIAVIKLVGASGLKTANFGDSSSVKVGDKVVGVGNAGGVGGTPSAAAGQVTALNQSITASDESGQDSEQLTGIIATDAPIQAGDSGAADNSSNKVIGIDTAASTGRGTSQGFTIPINHALEVASEIEQGVQTTAINIGSPAALGVGLSQTGGLTLSQVYAGRAAAAAGLVAGDTITAMDGTSVTTQDALKDLITAKEPGDKVTVTYTDDTGTSHTVTVTLGDGPAV